jgi:hypothetical protein
MRLTLESPGHWVVYDEEGLAARGHLEIAAVPQNGTPWDAAPVLFVADWTAQRVRRDDFDERARAA